MIATIAGADASKYDNTARTFTGADAVVKSDPPQVEEQLGLLEHAVDLLWKATEALQPKLSSVLSNPANTDLISDVEVDDSVSKELVPLAGRIESLRFGINRIVGKLGDLERRIEL